MNLAGLPRRRYTQGKTPIEKLEHLTKLLDGPDIYIKRDDLLGLSAGGNKTRKLEFVVADALEKGADTLITCGAVQSNHCRLTLAAAVKEGLKCRLVLEERVPKSYNKAASGNNFLFQLLGVEEIKVVPGGADLQKEMQAFADDLAANGRKGYIIPGGASNEVGSVGYVSCALEILEQTYDMGLDLDYVVAPSGSMGTHTGLVVGFVGTNSNIPVIGISTRREKAAQEEALHGLANRTAAFLNVKAEIPKDAITVFDDWVGPGYSLPTDEMVEAIEMFAKTEGVLLDPVYTGKEAAGLIGLIRRGYFKKGQNVLFIHTGGSPALYAYQHLFNKD